MTSLTSRSQLDLEEAMREIQLLAGLEGHQPGDRMGRERSVVVGVTSPDYGDGKTTTAIALAGSIASDLGVDVTLVDLDFQTASIARAYGIEREPGIADVLGGTQNLPAVTHHPVGIDNLSVIGTGAQRADAARIVRSDRLPEIVSQMRGTSRFIVCDLPATLRSMTAPVLAQQCDAVVVVARAGRTTRPELDRTVRLLATSNVAGIVINRYKTRIPAFLHRALGYQD